MSRSKLTRQDAFEKMERNPLVKQDSLDVEDKGASSATPNSSQASLTSQPSTTASPPSTNAATPNSTSTSVSSDQKGDFSKLDVMRKNFVGFDRKSVQSGFLLDTLATATDSSITFAGEVGVEFGLNGAVESALSSIVKNGPLVSAIGDAVKAGWSVLKTIIGEIKGAITGRDEYKNMSKWEKFKGVLNGVKRTLLSLGEEVLGIIPFVRSIFGAVKMVMKIVQFYTINQTRHRMIENRRKFKDKYRGKKVGDEEYIEKSHGAGAWLKKKTNIKKTDETVNKELVGRRYFEGDNEKIAVSSEEKKDLRQYLIDNRLKKLSKDRQKEKMKDFALEGLSTVGAVLNDVSFVATFTGIGAVAKAIVEGVNLGVSMGKAGLDLLRGWTNSGDMQKKRGAASRYTGIMLEHIGDMSPYQDKDEINEEYDMVDSDIEATGVDKKELYENNHKPKKQQALLIDAFME